MALCIAIYDRDDALLFLSVKDRIAHSPLEVQRFLHCSCDVAVDKVNFPPNKSNQLDNLLGTLLLSDNFRSYAYLTNTGTKFIMVAEAENIVLREHEIRLFFKKLHLKYCNAISNPFYKFGSPLKPRYIDATVKELFDSF